MTNDKSDPWKPLQDSFQDSLVVGLRRSLYVSFRAAFCDLLVVAAWSSLGAPLFSLRTQLGDSLWASFFETAYAE